MKQLEQNKKYRFSKELFITHEYSRNNAVIANGWEELLDGQEIERIDKGFGFIGHFAIMPKWCVEV